MLEIIEDFLSNRKIRKLQELHGVSQVFSYRYNSQSGKRSFLITNETKLLTPCSVTDKICILSESALKAYKLLHIDQHASNAHTQLYLYFYEIFLRGHTAHALSEESELNQLTIEYLNYLEFFIDDQSNEQ